MASTPLYKALKKNGTSFYAFPGAAEDISAAYQNENYKMYFSHYILLNFPKQNLVDKISDTQHEYIKWDFDVFYKSNNALPPNNYSDQLIESLRNYVANHEVVMKESKLNSNEYFYDNNEPRTPTEKIFWKWCKKLNLIDFEPAKPEEDYFSNLPEFERNNINDDNYFPEILWRERRVIKWNIVSLNISPNNNITVEFESKTNFKKGDIIHLKLFNISILNDAKIKIIDEIQSNSTNGQIFELDYQPPSMNFPINGDIGYAELVYHRLVQYIGEITGVNNVQNANRCYTEVYAFIPDHVGQTPDILFRIHHDRNYKPNMTYPILPSQIQPEIVGAEMYNSPIVSEPQNYPGSYFGHYDTEDYTYITSNGDTLRRSGDYYGVYGDINNIIIDSTNIDGLIIDFDHNHYVKMNIDGGSIKTFDQFNSLTIGNQPPKDFEFNAILWYYTIEDNKGNKVTNLYGISFLDHPDNNVIDNEKSIRIPTYKKLASNDNQDGVSYAFSLNLNFNIINDNPQDLYNPDAINSLYSMSNFNEAMKRLASINDVFLNVVSEHITLKDEIINLKQLLYTQTELNVINNKIKYLENILKLYKTNQIKDSESIKVNLEEYDEFPYLKLENVDPSYKLIYNIRTTHLYNDQGIIPMNINVPLNKNFLINVINDDETAVTLPNNDRLTIILDRDLYYKQTCYIVINATPTSTQNKKLNIYINHLFYNLDDNNNMNTSYNTQSLFPQYINSNEPVITPFITNIDLPVYYNIDTQDLNLSAKSKKFNFDIDFTKNITLYYNSVLEIYLDSHPKLINNIIKKGDVIVINDFLVTNDVNNNSTVVDFSGQYVVNYVDQLNSYIQLDVTTNELFNSYTNNSNTNNQYYYIHKPDTDPTQYVTYLLNKPYITLNRGIKIKITRINEEDTSPINLRYLIEYSNL